MNQGELKTRTKRFGLGVMTLVDDLPRTAAGRAIGNQLIRSGTSVGANYRAACRGRSKAEFISKLGVVIEEADESAFWLELIAESGMLPSDKVAPLYYEAQELTAIFAASARTAKANNPKSPNRRP